MGIGAYESFQYVQELGGRIQVDSTPGVGHPGTGVCFRCSSRRLETASGPLAASVGAHP